MEITNEKDAINGVSDEESPVITTISGANQIASTQVLLTTNHLGQTQGI